MIGREEFLKKLLEIMSENAQATRSDKSTLQDYLEMLEEEEEKKEERDYEASKKADAITDPNDPNRIAYIESLVEVGRPSLCNMAIMASQINTRMAIAILDENLNRYEKCIASITALINEKDESLSKLYIQQYINLIEALVSLDKNDITGATKIEVKIKKIVMWFEEQGYTLFDGVEAFKAIQEEDAFTPEDHEAAIFLSYCSFEP